MVLREPVEEDHSEVRRRGLRRVGVVFDPLLHFRLMGLRPFVDVLRVRRIGLDPGLRQTVMGIRPLRDDVGSTLVLILLEPRVDVGTHGFTLLRATAVLNERAEYAGHTGA